MFKFDDFPVIRPEHFEQFSVREKTLAQAVVWSVLEDLNQLRKAHRVSTNYKKAKDKDYASAVIQRDMQEVQRWIWSKSEEEGSLLWWCHIFSEDPDGVQRNIIKASNTTEPIEEDIILPKCKYALQAPRQRRKKHN